MAKTYYHLTSSKNLDNIMQYGLLPKIGLNSKSIGERKPRIYLCDEKSIRYWKVLLGPEIDTILEISDPRIRIDLGTIFTRYNEWVKMSPIKPEYIKICKKNVPVKQARHELQVDYIGSISRASEMCARYYSDERYHNKEFHEDIYYELISLKTILPRLHYEEGMYTTSIKHNLKQSGEDGDYTMDDWYDIDPNVKPTRRLWEMLIEYPEDDLSELRLWLYQFIKTTFPEDVLSVNTGGYTL